MPAGQGEHEGARAQTKSGRAIGDAWRRRRFRISLIATAAVLAVGVGFGAGRVIGLGNAVIPAGIPHPATGRDAFVTLDNLHTTVTVGRATRSGLLASVLQSAQTSAIGGPLVNLNGQVIGITIGGSGTGLHVMGYAIPINTALAVATRIADSSSAGS
jgi:hypothetical protein